jgi:site-specific recombinase XerC
VALTWGFLGGRRHHPALPHTGMRLDEMAGLKRHDVDLDQNVAYVMGKGRRPGPAP